MSIIAYHRLQRLMNQVFDITASATQLGNPMNIVINNTQEEKININNNNNTNNNNNNTVNSLISNNPTAANSSAKKSSPLDPNLVIRRLESTDYAKGFLKILGQLTAVGTISRELFLKRFQQISNIPNIHFTYVIEDKLKGEIIGTATLIIEFKFIHECQSIGHIEDVVVSDQYRGKNLGFKIIEKLIEVGQKEGCYKIILDCEQKNIPFYEKLGFKENQKHMALYFNKEN